MRETFNVLRTLAFGVAVLALVAFIAALLLLAWLQATSLVWVSYGDQTLIYWLIGWAITVALVLVATW